MTRKEAKTLLPAITHFANDGELWAIHLKKWYKQSEVHLHQNDKNNIIKDKHFEARKADALGEDVEMFYMGVWDTNINPQWKDEFEYRPKSKEVYEWQFIFQEEGVYRITDLFYLEGYSPRGWTKFEPSKRLRKDK